MVLDSENNDSDSSEDDEPNAEDDMIAATIGDAVQMLGGFISVNLRDGGENSGAREEPQGRASSGENEAVSIGGVRSKRLDLNVNSVRQPSDVYGLLKLDEEYLSKREEKKQRTELFRERVEYGIDLLNTERDIDNSHSIEKRKWESLKPWQKRFSRYQR